jgi:mannose-6-phosphate isomerase
VFLGPDHVAAFGPDPALLVKLLDAQQRLSVHLHPSRPFVRSHLKTRYGKSEAWYILAADPGSVIHMGFKSEVSAAELLQVVESGTGVSLLERMNPVSVSPGDTIFVPGGLPHAIGAGIFMVELQEPSDLLVRLEWSGYSVGAIPSDLGLGFSTALGAVDRSAWTVAKLEAITRRAGTPGRLLPVEADPFFRLEHASNGQELAQGFMVLVGVCGEGAIRALGKSTPIKTGECFMVPWASGRIAIEGEVDVVCCRPGDPAAARKSDPDLLKYH